MLRLIFMGTSSFGLPCLEYLGSRDDIGIAAVVTKPPRPRGRGRILKDTQIKELSIKKGLSTLEVEDVRDENFIKNIRALNPELTIVVAFGKILPRDVLDIPKHGSINIHASLLPLYRGPSPINWAIINGESETGVTSFFMEEGMDTGAIICQRSIPIWREDDCGMLEEKLKNLSVEVLAETIDKIKNNEGRAMPQDEAKATLAPKITQETGKIDWSWDGERIYNLIRGLSPRPGAYSFFTPTPRRDVGARGFTKEEKHGSILIKIWKGLYLKDVSAGGEAGKVLGVDGEGIKISSGKGIVIIKELQPAGKKRMTGKAFWSGYGS